MRRLVLLAGLALLLVVLTLGSAFAAMEMEDPYLCVAGQWLTVEDADPVAVIVTVPAGTLWGAAGNCSGETPSGEEIGQPAVRQDKSPVMRVQVTGGDASQPVIVTYGDKQFERPNNLKHVLVFQFNLK